MSSVDRRGITNACQDDPCHLQLRVTRLEIANAPAGPASIGRPASRTVAGDGGESTETSAATDNKGAAFSQRAGAGPLTTFSLERSLSAGYEVEAAGGGVPVRRGARHKYGILLSLKNADRNWEFFWYRILPWIVLRVLCAPPLTLRYGCSFCRNRSSCWAKTDHWNGPNLVARCRDDLAAHSRDGAPAERVRAGPKSRKPSKNWAF